MSKLDDILAFADGIDAYDDKQEAKVALKQLMLDMVGEDREYGPNDLPEVIEQIKTENRVNARLRTKINAL